jgi:hypothetical protein
MGITNVINEGCWIEQWFYDTTIHHCSLVTENDIMLPSSADSIPTSLGQEIVRWEVSAEEN